jgi:hypothetical protein
MPGSQKFAYATVLAEALGGLLLILDIQTPSDPVWGHCFIFFGPERTVGAPID